MPDTEKLIMDKLGEMSLKMDSMNQRMEEGFKNLSDRMEVVEIKEKMTHKKLNNLSLDIEMMRKDIRSDINALNDETETLIAVLEAKGILPKVIND